MQRTGNTADLLVRGLAAAEVRRIYGIAGDSLSGVKEALRSRDAAAVRGGTGKGLHRVGY